MLTPTPEDRTTGVCFFVLRVCARVRARGLMPAAASHASHIGPSAPLQTPRARPGPHLHRRVLHASSRPDLVLRERDPG
eukprot:3107876-Heterocapsa_arctica.AAC.1